MTQNRCKVVRSDVARLELVNNRLRFENEKLAAILEYVAMMTDVELPDESGEAEESEETEEEAE